MEVGDFLGSNLKSIRKDEFRFSQKRVEDRMTFGNLERLSIGAHIYRSGRNVCRSDGNVCYPSKSLEPQRPKRSLENLSLGSPIRRCSRSRKSSPTVPCIQHSWSLPQGAAEIIKTLAAEIILLEMINNVGRLGVVNHNAIRNMVSEFPVLCTKKYTIKIGKENEQELSLLSTLCLLNSPLRLIQLVYSLHPEAISTKEPGLGSIPLHYACRRSSQEVVEFLVEKFPESVRSRRKNGTLPIHTACHFNPRPELISFLIQKYPQGCATCCSKGWSPLHCAVNGRAPLEVIVELHQAFPPSAGFVNDKGRTPLHIACARRNNPSVVGYLGFAAGSLNVRDANFHTPLFLAAKYQTPPAVRMLLEWTRTTRPSMDADGRSLLHVACAYNTADVVDMIASRFPAMVTCRTANLDRFTPLHEVCRINPHSSLSIIQTLIKHNRRFVGIELCESLTTNRMQLVNMRDSQGRTARYHAHMNEASPEVIGYLMECESEVFF